MRRLPLFAAVLVGCAVAAADGPRDNAADKVRPVPPKGVAVPAAVRAKLEAELAVLKADLDAVMLGPGANDLVALKPDAEVFYYAVRAALELDGFYSPKDIEWAGKLIRDGRRRCADLQAGRHPWTTQTGLVVRGYKSVIDDSVQPYGLEIPAGHDFTKPARLDVWWHGRDEELSEVRFLRLRQTAPGEFPPAPGTVVLHPYGRYCNGSKFAGETDTFEAIAALSQTDRQFGKPGVIDPDRVVARGFSLGGAACWHMAVHHPDVWCAAAPGAGFSETPDFLKVFQNEKVEPAWYEQKLWHLYNATDYAGNLRTLPTIAYSGEIDKQKQAADLMQKAMTAEGLTLKHVIGAKAGHHYTPAAKAEIVAFVDAAAARPVRPPSAVSLTTYTLRYAGRGGLAPDRADWVSILGLGKHWVRAHVAAELKDGVPHATTENVTLIRLGVPGKTAVLDGQPVTAARADLVFTRVAGTWQPYPGPSPGLTKSPGRQGPIDDAFYSRFVNVRPTGKPLHAETGDWAAAEMTHATTQWKKQFRGDALAVDDAKLTDADIASANLVLWGDPQSNSVLARVLPKLPIQWTAEVVTVGDKTYSAGTHMPVLIYPNPLNPAKYVVLNSGFTFREYDQLNNARQVPKLPDYAVVDITTPPDSRHPGKIVRAGFFGERWELLPDDGR